MDLTQKYASAIKEMDNQGVKIQEQSQRSGRLYIKATAPSGAAKNKVWDEIKKIDATYSDLVCDIVVVEEVNATTEENVATHLGSLPTQYTVKPGDTLSKISQLFYGTPSKYMKIFEANKDKLDDPNLIKAGQVLSIPS